MSGNKEKKVKDLLDRWGGMKLFSGKPRDPKRIDRLVNKLRQLWHMVPDLRLGQLISYLETHLPADKAGVDPFHIEDDIWEAAIDAALEERSKA